MEYTTIASLNYLDKLDLYEEEKPFVCTIAPWSIPGAKRNNLSLTAYDTIVTDMRLHLDELSTDVHGFSVTKSASKISHANFGDDEYVREHYFSECVALLKSRFNAEKVHIFDHTVHQDPGKQLTGEEILRPAYDVHVDQTPASVRRRVESIFPEESAALLRGRVRILNLWRPLISPVRDHPIAVCDYRSTSSIDYVPTDLPSPYWIGELFLLNYNPNHQWYFLKDMELDEVLVLKCFDSAAEQEGSRIALCAPHTAFDWKDTPADATPRKSLEIRALVFSHS
ncbi:hypothetical protein K469DRAFT_544469 [Zopfia rhizophila CBS 207.26]|uniref:Methyltransferase n=1 Tax=Zopfia rhizophila CBS 207.26 TaxID=1314779 RepID=A0A6A6EVK5_9PEZI|nr:hypothetical protein K469DRAFT_544469 [Zopfia rhizophila CBS 207.26]